MYKSTHLGYFKYTLEYVVFYMICILLHVIKSLHWIKIYFEYCKILLISLQVIL